MNGWSGQLEAPGSEFSVPCAPQDERQNLLSTRIKGDAFASKENTSLEYVKKSMTPEYEKTERIKKLKAKLEAKRKKII